MPKDEEQPQVGFKVTDRRLFDESGKLREEAPVEKKAADPAPAARPTPVPPRQKEEKKEPEKPKAPAESPKSATGKEDFLELLNFLYTQAHFALGNIPGGSENLEMAKKVIDWMAVLEEKTRGNLSSEEERLVKGALYELKMSFLSKSKTIRL